MDLLIWIVVVVLVVVLLMAFAGRRVRGGVDPTQLTFEPDLINRVRALAQANQKISAIKLLREGTPGLGLASAKVMVDRMANPRSVPGLVDPGADTGLDATPSSATVPLEVDLQARSLKAADRQIEAIKLVRAHTSWGLREAKEYVDGL